ncbi:MAG: type IV pilus secretin family protein [Gallionellaceae bacterium]|nr:MAG: type IV pilus secretin family protein [Gallionellaceae bacterium]
MRQFFNPVRSILRLAIVAVSIWSVGANAEISGGDTNSILSLSAAPAAGGKLVLKVALKNAPLNQPAAFTINTPPRIAFDFPNTANGLGKSTQEFGEGDLRGVNIVQAGSRTRLVVNLNQMLSYDTRIDGNNVLITLQGKVAAGNVEPVTTARFAEAKPSIQAHSLRDVDFRRGKNGEGRVQVDLSDSSVGIDIKQQGKTLVVDFAKTSLPRNLQRKLDVADFGTPVQLVDAFAQGETVRLVIEPKGAWEYAAYQTDNKFIIEVKTVVESVKGSRSTYAGEKLSLNFQNIATREALNVIADFTNLNMVISDTVSGNLTLRLKDVPWDQALQIILDSRGLLQQKEGNVIMVAPRDEIAARQKDALTTQRVISQLEPVQTEAYPLSYAKVADVKAVLAGYQKQSAANEGDADAKGAGGENIAFDTRTNTLYITATLSRLSQIREIIKKLDVPVRQVLIEARFVEATNSYNRTLGGRLGYQGPAVTAGGGTAIGGTGTSAQITSANVNLPGAASGMGGLSLSLFDQLASKTLSLELTASELDGTTKSIASPRVMTGDSTPATIKSGVQIPYAVAGSSTSGPSIAFKDATLSLVVTPKITPDDKVTMQLDVTQDTVGNMYGGVPSINKKQVTTTVLVENGGTVVIGGVYTQDTTDSSSKVPLLGDIPVLGWLFKNNTKTDAKKELLIFITPKILKESLSLN